MQDTNRQSFDPGGDDQKCTGQSEAPPNHTGVNISVPVTTIRAECEEVIASMSSSPKLYRSKKNESSEPSTKATTTTDIGVKFEDMDESITTEQSCGEVKPDKRSSSNKKVPFNSDTEQTDADMTDKQNSNKPIGESVTDDHRSIAHLASCGEKELTADSCIQTAETRERNEPNIVENGKEYVRCSIIA